VIGWDHEISALNTESALAFYRRWYAPNNAILIVTGDVDAAEVRRLAEKHYGPIAAKPVPARARPTEPPQHAARRVILKSPRVNQPNVSIRYLAPSYRTSNEGEVYTAPWLSSRAWRRRPAPATTPIATTSRFSPSSARRAPATRSTRSRRRCAPRSSAS
jgi:hypothetical protein